MTNIKHCPGCSHHCDLDMPQCEYGKKYLHEHNPKDKNINLKDKHDNYETLNIDHQLILNLRDLGHVIRFSSEGKSSQKHILIMLYEFGTMKQSELTKRIGIRSGSASEVIGKLEHSGLITRVPNPQDNRTTDVCLTDQGKSVAESAIANREHLYQEMFAELSMKEKNILLGLIEKLNCNWSQHYHHAFRSHKIQHKNHGNYKDKGGI